MARDAVLLLALSLLSGLKRKKQIVKKQIKVKRKCLPTTMQASMVITQARTTGKTVSFAKY